jgi:murein DD-endopeptidase MepM/ murein hydrolase activator NlpD
MNSQLISTNDTLTENPFGLSDQTFILQIETLSKVMSEAYYRHIYMYTQIPAGERVLPPLVTPSGVIIEPAPETNAGTYAIMAALAFLDIQNLPARLDNNSNDGFYMTYQRIFNNENPLDESNDLSIPGEFSAMAAPDTLLQLPYLRGFSWKFGGVHDASGSGGDKSSIDFYPSGSTWGIDTSGMWVVAAADGLATKLTPADPALNSCYVKISHSGIQNSGWETVYYHLNVPSSIVFPSSVKQNDKIGVIANNNAQATCNGGSASGPHVHFSLKYNGLYTAIDGTPLSGWYVHCNASTNCTTNYDTDPTHMWLERNGEKKYPFNSTVLSEAPPITVPYVVSSVLNKSYVDPLNLQFDVTFSEPVSGVDETDFSLTTSGFPDASITSVSGSSALYSVLVSKGTPPGTIRLDVLNDGSILDLSNNPLNAPFSNGETYSSFLNATFTSAGLNDGQVLESLETSNKGGSLNATGTTLNLGDDASDRQFRAILHFNTASLPDNAIITSLTIKVKKYGTVGTNPFNTHGPLLVDIRSASFGTSALTIGDFQAWASQIEVANFTNTIVNNWYSAVFNDGASINKTGTTQFRLRFTKDDNDDRGADQIKFFSGNYATAASRPQLIIQYYVP